jgi:hypothetical protein
MLFATQKTGGNGVLFSMVSLAASGTIQGIIEQVKNDLWLRKAEYP